jgi:hypothetical protein
MCAATRDAGLGSTERLGRFGSRFARSHQIANTSRKSTYKQSTVSLRYSVAQCAYSSVALLR